MVIGLAIGASVLSNPARADDEIRKQWETQKSLSENWFRQMPVLGDRRIDELFQLQVEARQLKFSSQAAPTPGDQQMRVRVEGVPGTGFVTLHRDPVTKELDRFELNVMDFPAPNRVTNLQVRCDMDKGRIILTQTIQAGGGNQQTMLIQTLGQDASTQLLVSSSSPDNRSSQQLNFSSSDFVSFLREYPQPSNLYLRPLFRTIEHENLFAPDPSTAWQVFADTRAPDQSVMRRLNEILPRLNAEDYRARRTALAELRKIPQPAGADAVNHLPRATLTPQQNLLLDLYLAPLKPASDSELNRLRTDPTFLLDCLYAEDVQVRRAALDRLRTLFHPGLDFDIDAPADIRALAIMALRKQLTPNR
jgi:hypothetical protein